MLTMNIMTKKATANAANPRGEGGANDPCPAVFGSGANADGNSSAAGAQIKPKPASNPNSIDAPVSAHAPITVAKMNCARVCTVRQIPAQRSGAEERAIMQEVTQM